jgi:hypothetical protein
MLKLSRAAALDLLYFTHNRMAPIASNLAGAGEGDETWAHCCYPLPASASFSICPPGFEMVGTMQNTLRAERFTVLDEHTQELFEECREAIEKTQEFIAQSQKTREK